MPSFCSTSGSLSSFGPRITATTNRYRVEPSHEVAVSLLKACEWLESTAVGIGVRESLYGFPILVAVHILSLTMSVGIVIWARS